MKECVKVKNVLSALILANLLLQAPIAAEDSGPGSDLFLNFLELYAANPASSSGENASSLVNSVRNNTSIYSSQIVKYNEVSSQSSSPLSPGFKYSRRFEDSDWFIGVNNVLIADIPLPVIIFVLVAIVLAIVLGTTTIGRQIYQIGTNPIAAKHAGIKSNQIKVGLFLTLGLVSAVGGLMTASRLGSVRYDIALGGELQMVLMAMLGGTYIFGGRGTILGTFLAAWLLVIVSTGMTVANLLPAIQLTVLGVLLVVAIIATNFIYSRTQR